MFIALNSIYPVNEAGTLKIEDLEELLKTIKPIKDYFIICHDKDLKDDLTPKQEHYHILIDVIIKEHRSIIEILEQERAVKVIRKVCPNLWFEKVKNPSKAVQYLIHKNNPEKYKYEQEEIRTNNHEKLELLMLEEKVKITNDVLLEELFKWLAQKSHEADMKKEIFLLSEEELMIWFLSKHKLDYYMRNQEKIMTLAGVMKYRIRRSREEIFKFK